MNTIFLFPIDTWEKQAVESFLRTNKIDFKLRIGFSFLIAISEIEHRQRELQASTLCYTLGFDKAKSMITKIGYEISATNTRAIQTVDMLETIPNLTFDLQNFGYVLWSTVDLEAQYNIIRSSEIVEGNRVDILKTFECRDIISNQRIHRLTRKLTLDYFTLIGTAFLTPVRFHHKSNLLYQYSNIFLLSFITRAQYEKLMLLAAQIDPKLSFRTIDNSKKMKSTFRKCAAESDLPETLKLYKAVNNLELLDDKFRTPETHKLGRIFGLVNNGHFGTALNEVLSFQNTANSIFVDFCRLIRKETTDLDGRSEEVQES